MKWPILIILLLVLVTPVFAQDKISRIVTQSLAEQIDAAIICGNGKCQEGENSLTCPEDCTEEINELNIFMKIVLIGFIYLALRGKR